MAMFASSERYHQSTEHRSSITSVTRSEKSVVKENRLYKEESEQSNDYSKSREFESKSSFADERKSHIPIPTGHNAIGNESKQQRKVKHKLVRKVKRRTSSAEDDKKSNETEKNNNTDQNLIENTEHGTRESEPKTKVSVSTKSQVGKSTTVRIGQPEPVHIIFNPQKDKTAKENQFEYKEEPDTEQNVNRGIYNQREGQKTVEDQVDEPEEIHPSEASRLIEEDREKNRRRKTTPVTLTIKPSKAKDTDRKFDGIDKSSIEDQGKESASEREKRTSIRIVNSKTSDNETGERKLKIDARSTKRITPLSDTEAEYTRKTAVHSASDIYNEKARKLINRKSLNRQPIREDKLESRVLQKTAKKPSHSRYHTLPRNFKTVRLPIQLHKEAVIDKDNLLQVDQKFTHRKQLRRFSADSYLRSDNFSETSRSITSTKSHNLNLKNHRKSRHSCRLDGINFEEEDGPTLKQRSKEDRRRSNPNLILGRTDIQGLRRARPKSEVIGVQRSASLPRSTQKPRVKSEHYNEFVTIHDFDEFNLKKSRTLPYRKKRVSYQQDNRGQEVEVIRENSQLQQEDIQFQKHIEEHQRFQKNLINSEKTTTKTQEDQQSKTRVAGFDALTKKSIITEEQTTNKASSSITGKGHQLEPNVSERGTSDRIEPVIRETESKVQEQRVDEEVVHKKNQQPVSRSQSLPRKKNKETEKVDAKKLEFDQFIRQQRELLLQQLSNRETNSNLENRKTKDITERQVDDSKAQSKQDKEVISRETGNNSDKFLELPKSSNKGRRHKSVNDVDAIRTVLEGQASSEEVSHSAKQKSKFLLQNNKEAKNIENIESRGEDKDIIRVFARGPVIRLSMEGTEREKFEQRQKEYDQLQQRQQEQQQQQQKVIEDDRYRYMNNEFDRRNITKAYYQTEQQYNGHVFTGQRLSDSHQSRSTSGKMTSSITDGYTSNDNRGIDATKITRIKQEQLQGGLDDVFYSICTHYFYPEDHELIVNLHRYGHIKVPKGLDHEDTCIFYNHLYVYEKEDVFAETLAPIAPKIQTEIVQVEEDEPVFAEQEDDTRSMGSSASYSYDYNDDTSSQYSSASRRDRNLYASFKAQQYYDAKHNPDSNNNNRMSIDKAFDSTYETLRNKRRSTNTDEEDSYRAISPNSSSGRSDSFTYSKPRLLRRSNKFPGVGHEVENDYPRWRPKSPAQPDRNYGLSVALPP